MTPRACPYGPEGDGRNGSVLKNAPLSKAAPMLVGDVACRVPPLAAVSPSAPAPSGG